MEISMEVIDKREAKLQDAGDYLKKEFVGIDDIIDKFIDSVRIWYLMPEVLTRPLIVNLWGITGVGKTDLVRKFVNYIDFSDRFCEIQLDSKEGSGTVQNYLETVFDSGDEEGILLLDEIQRFRSIQQDGSENNSTKFQDLWMLLSDGTFQSDAKIKNDLIRILLEDSYWSERYEEEEEEDPKETPAGGFVQKKKKKERVFQTHYWEAMRIKKLLKVPDSVRDIMTWDQEKKVNNIKKRLTSKEVFEGTKYSRLLIVVSGNLDEAFTMASDVEDADRDADVYHEYSKTIDIIRIKGALKTRFKPEQIARLGNIHLIYPILSKEAYRSIIKQKAKVILDNVKKKHDVRVRIDKSIVDVIYDNGVFPTQGVRPLLSTISSILENSLATFVFRCIRTGVKQCKLTCQGHTIISEIDGQTVTHKIPRVLDDIKTGQTADKTAMISVHEAGHAVMYALLFKTAPTQIVASTTNYNAEGFVGNHSTLGSLTDKLKQIQVALAGRVAEEFMFGKENVTDGASSDYNYATTAAGAMVRRYGMGRRPGAYQPPVNHKGYVLHDINSTDEEINAILEKADEQLRDTFSKNLDFFYAVVERLLDDPAILPEDFKKIADKYVEGGVQVISAKESIEVPYNKLMCEKLGRPVTTPIE